MTSGAVPGFRASERGFRFTNSFPPEPTVTIDLGPAGKVGLGDASQGVCGGMAFTVRDYFEAGESIPDATEPPPTGSPLFDYIVQRLIDSFDLPLGVTRYAVWMAMPSADIDAVVVTTHGAAYRTVRESWPAIKHDIDSGHPSPLGLVPIHTADISKIGKCHQVLAYAYSIDESTNTLELSIYDPNTPNSSADDVWIRVPLGHPQRGIRIDHNVNIAEPTLHGFFRSEYTAKHPPASV